MKQNRIETLVMKMLMDDITMVNCLKKGSKTHVHFRFTNHRENLPSCLTTFILNLIIIYVLFFVVFRYSTCISQATVFSS